MKNQNEYRQRAPPPIPKTVGASVEEAEEARRGEVGEGALLMQLIRILETPMVVVVVGQRSQSPGGENKAAADFLGRVFTHCRFQNNLSLAAAFYLTPRYL